MCLAVPGKVIEIVEAPDPQPRRAKVDFAGIRRDVCLAFTPQASIGDYVLVHVGFALDVINEVEARRIFETLDQLEVAGELHLEGSA